MTTAFERRVQRLRDHVLNHDIEVMEDETGISKMKIAELKELLEEKGIEYDPKAKREDLIKLLEGAE